tara:strand:+ start:309 stop:866 length:558 start_codon:yes stop_codon:yes gene_type:complete
MDNTKGLIVEIPFTEEMVKSAKAKAKEMGSIRNSILKGKGNFAGFLGEEAVAAYIGAEIISFEEGDAKYGHDILKNKKRIEVKTKRRTVEPRLFYDVSVAASSKHQADKSGLDLYIFASIEFDGDTPKRIWIIGQKDRDQYFTQARFIKKGEAEGNNGFRAHTDMYNLITTELDGLHDSLLPQKQ